MIACHLRYRYFALCCTTLLVIGSANTEETELVNYTNQDIEVMIRAVDQNADGWIDHKESSRWLFADLFFQASERNEHNQIATQAMIEQLIAANAAGAEIIDQGLYQSKVLEAYEDSTLTADEIAYMSGERVFPEGSTYVDDNLTVAALMTLDRDGNGVLTIQELLQEDLNQLIEEELTTMTISPQPQPRTEFVTKRRD